MSEPSLTEVFTQIADGNPLGALSGLQALDAEKPLVALNQALYAPLEETVQRLALERERMQDLLNSVTPTGRECAMLIYNLGCIELQNDDIQGAQLYFQDTLEVLPGFLPALHNLAYTSELLAETEEAERLYREVIRVAPDFVLSRLNLALLRWQGGNRQAALTDLRALVAQQPHNASLVLYLSRVLLDDANPSTAEEALTAIGGIADWEQYPPLRECHALASYLLGEIGTAEEAFRKLLDEAPDNQFVRSGLIRILASRMAWDELHKHAQIMHNTAPTQATQKLTSMLSEISSARGR